MIVRLILINNFDKHEMIKKNMLLKGSVIKLEKKNNKTLQCNKYFDSSIKSQI